MADQTRKPTPPGLRSLGADAKRVARLYPLRAAPTPMPWQPTPVAIPAHIRGLTEGLAGYDS